MRLKGFLKFRILFLIALILLSIVWIHPKLDTNGVAIINVQANSSAYDSGIRTLDNVSPTGREIIKYVNSEEIKNTGDYAKALDGIPLNLSLKITTNKNTYYILRNSEDLGINVDDVASTNIRKGLDLQGGTRVILKPEEELSEEQFDLLLNTMNNRLNFYGLKDIKVKDAKDLLGNRFIVVEIAGATKEDVKELVASQGKFEARIGNDSVFTGDISGNRDVVFVCRNDGTCSGIRDCQESSGGQVCNFEFAIKLSQDAAKRHASITKDLEVNLSAGSRGVLSEKLDFYLDGKLYDSLFIGSDLKGKEAIDIAISGPGFGITAEEAFNEASKNMNKLQTILETGSLPTKLEIVELKSISPVLGAAFVGNALKIGLFGLLAVALFIFIRYREWKIAIPMVGTSAAEVFIIIGIAAVAKQNLDLAAIAGIIAAVGTGFDDLIVISDETTRTGEYAVSNWKEKVKRAFFVIMVAWVVAVASMLPLFWAGAGLFTGFAITTIIGVTIGVFVTRPAYAAIVEELMRED